MKKLEYIHHNPVVAQLISSLEDYKYSSSTSYETGSDAFNMITHYRKLIKKWLCFLYRALKFITQEYQMPLAESQAAASQRMLPTAAELSSIQLCFMKFTAQQIKFALAIDNPALLEQCSVNKTDSKYQLWKRKPLNIELSSEKVFLQKLEYIHYNPVKSRYM